MEFTTRQIAEILEGQLEGDPHLIIKSISKIEEGIEGSITFLANPKYENYIYSTRASAIIIDRHFVLSKSIGATLIRVDDPYSSLTTLLELFQNERDSEKRGQESPCFVDKSAIIDESAYIGAFSYIGKGVRIDKGVKIYPQVFVGEGVQIGENSVLYPGVKVYAHCRVGKEVIIHSGSVIGGDGFGFAPQPDGTFSKIIQSGNVILEDLVEIGANTCVDRATLGSTIIRKGVKLDNLIQIAHNVEIGNDTVIAAQTGISGSTKIGENCVLGGQVGVVGHIQVGKKNQFGARSGINKTIKEEGKQFRGQPLMPYKDSLKMEVFLRNLPDLEERLKDLEDKLAQLTQDESAKDS